MSPHTPTARVENKKRRGKTEPENTIVGENSAIGDQRERVMWKQGWQDRLEVKT